MSEQMNLDDILNDKPVERPAPEPAAPAPDKVVEASTDGVTKPDPVEKQIVERPISRKQAARDKEQLAQGRVRDPETGQYAKIEEKPAAEPAKEPAKAAEPAKPATPTAAPPQEFTEKEKAFLRAAQEERGKRQALEQRLAAMEAAKNAPAAPTEAPKTFWDDPEAALARHTAQVRAEATNARLGMAEFTARQKHPDFDEKVAEFAKIIQTTPGLHQQWLAAPDPAEFAYNLAKNHMELREVGGIEELRAKIERDTAARVRAEVEAELKAKAEALAKDRAAIPPSLSEVRATGSGNRPVWSGPSSLDSILGKG